MISNTRKIISSTSFPSFVLTIIFIVINIIITPGFLKANFINGFFASNTPLFCIAIGLSMVIIGGGLDISLGAMITLVNVIFIQLLGLKWDTWIAIAACLGVSIVLGLINGIVIGIFRVKPLMATFATGSIYAGAALWVLPVPGGRIPASLADFYGGTFLGIPIAIYIIVIVLTLALIIMNSPVGIRLYAMGKDVNKAYSSAINVRRIKVFTYTFSGFAAGVAGITLTARIGGGDPNVALPMTLTCLAACVIGGIDLIGGRGNVIGAIWGVMFLQLIITTVFSSQISVYLQSLISGLILLAGILLSVAIARRSNKLA